VLGREIPLPLALREVAERPMLAEVVPVDVDGVKQRLRAPAG